MSAPVADRVPALFGATESRALRAAQEAFLAGAVGLEPPDVVPRLEAVFADAKTAVRTGLRIMAWWLELSPVFSSHLARFSRLSLAGRAAWIDRLATGGRASRTLYSVLKVLIQTVVYDDPAVLRSLELTRRA